MRRVAYASSSAVHLPLRSSTGAVVGAPGAALVGLASAIVGHVAHNILIFAKDRLYRYLGLL